MRVSVKNTTKSVVNEHVKGILYSFRPGQTLLVTERQAAELVRLNAGLVQAAGAQYTEPEVAALSRLSREQLLGVAGELMRGRHVDVASLAPPPEPAEKTQGRAPRRPE